jgi:transcriptional regulator with XRE-family HTH domain
MNYLSGVNWHKNIMEKEILIAFGQRVKKERVKLGLSQEKLAMRAGVHRTYIGMVERAEKNVTLSTIERIAKALNVKIADLF